MPSIDCHVPVQSSVPVSLSSSLRRIPRCLYWIFGRPRAPSAGPVGTLFHIYKEAQMERTLLRPGAPLDRQTRGRPATGSSMSLSETQTCKAWSLTDRGCVLALFSEVSWHTQVLLKHFTSVYMPTKPKCLTILTKVLLIHRWPAHGPEWPKVITVRLRDCGDTKVSYWPFLWYIMLPIWIYDASSTALDYICFTPSFSDIFSNTDKSVGSFPCICALSDGIYISMGRAGSGNSSVDELGQPRNLFLAFWLCLCGLHLSTVSRKLGWHSEELLQDDDLWDLFHLTLLKLDPLGQVVFQSCIHLFGVSPSWMSKVMFLLWSHILTR